MFEMQDINIQNTGENCMPVIVKLRHVVAKHVTVAWHHWHSKEVWATRSDIHIRTYTRT